MESCQRENQIFKTKSKLNCLLTLLHSLQVKSVSRLTKTNKEFTTNIQAKYCRLLNTFIGKQFSYHLRKDALNEDILG